MARKKDCGNSVTRFAECAVTMRNILYEDAPLTEAESHFIENHFHVLEMAYLRWKQKRMPHPTTVPAETSQAKAA